MTNSSYASIFTKKLQEINWEPIAYKLNSQGWNEKKTSRGIIRYIMFLILCHLYPNYTIVADEEVDEVWHTHILDTMKYAQDCQYLFGHFLHHFPYLGLRGEEDEKKLNSAFDNTQSLYSEHFGDHYTSKLNPASCQPPIVSKNINSPASCEPLILMYGGNLARPSFKVDLTQWDWNWVIST